MYTIRSGRAFAILMVVVHGPRSEYAGKLAVLQPVIGNEMQAASEPLLVELIQNVLVAVFGEVAAAPKADAAPAP